MVWAELAGVINIHGALIVNMMEICYWRSWVFWLYIVMIVWALPWPGVAWWASREINGIMWVVC